MYLWCIILFSLPRVLISYPDMGSSAVNTVTLLLMSIHVSFCCGVVILLGYEAMSLNIWFMMLSDDVVVCHLQGLDSSTGRFLIVVELTVYL